MAAFTLSGCAVVTQTVNTPTPRALTFASQLDIHVQHELIDGDIEDIEGSDHIGYLPKLAKVAKAQNIAVKILDLEVIFPEDGKTLWGYNAGNLILLSIHLPINGMVATLVHELGHHFQPDALDGKSSGQVFAEAVAYLFCKEIGLDTWDATSSYLLRYPDEHWVLQRYAKEIDETVDYLVESTR